MKTSDPCSRNARRAGSWFTITPACCRTAAATVFGAALLGSILTGTASAQRVSLVWDGDSQDDDGGVSIAVNARRDSLERAGFPTRVDRPHNSESWWDTYGPTTLYDALYVTAEANANLLADKLRGHATPILCDHPQLDENLGFADAEGTVASDLSYSIDNNSHPVTAGFAVGASQVYTDSNPIALLSGVAAPSLLPLGTQAASTCLAVIEAGGALTNTVDGNATAATRLVRLPFGPDANLSQRTADADRLLTQSVLWATANTYTPTGTLGALVMLTDENGVLSDQETWRVRRLAYMGWTVVLVWDGDSQANYDAAIAAAEVVYVAATVDATAVGDKLREAPCGVVYELMELDDNLGLATGGGTIGSHSSVQIEKRGHPITGNFYALESVNCFLRYNVDANNWPGSNQPMGRMTGTMAPDLEVLATRWADPVLAVIEQGDELANSLGGNTTASGRRVRLPWVSDALDITHMRSWNAGSQLWELALAWAAGPNPGDLIAHYKLDEASGTTCVDGTANGYDGEYRGGATLNVTPAPRSRAANFDATGEHIYAAPNSDFINLGANQGDYTIAMWYRRGAQTHNNWRNLFHLGGADANDRGPLIMVHPTNHRPHVWMSTTTIPNGTGGYCSYAIDEGQWTHLAMVKSGGFVRWYLDGEFINSFRINGETVASAGHLRIGQQSWWGSTDGDLDDVRVYDYALSDQAVAELHTTLVGHFRLADGSGAEAIDDSAYANDATLQGDPVWDPSEEALVLDGVGDSVVAPSGDQYDLASDLTIAAWVKVADPDENTYMRILSRKAGWSATEGFELEYNPNLNRLTFGGRDRQQLAASGVDLDSTWRHVCTTLTSDGSGKYYARLYVDGVELTTNVVAYSAIPSTMAANNFDELVPNDLDLAIGSDASGGSAFNGSLRDVRLYRRALSESEVFELGGSGLRMHLKLDETSGTLAEDSSPFGNDATLVDGPNPGAVGIIGAALSMSHSDTDDRIEALHTVVDGAEKITVAWWMKTEKTGETAILSGAVSGGSNGPNSFLVYFRSATQFSPWIDQSEAGRATLPESIADGCWHHYAFTCDRAAGEYRLYRDAVEIATRTFTPRSGGFSVDPGGLFIGHEQDAVGGSFSPEQSLVGDLDDFRIYGRVLSAAEIADLHGLVGHWRMDEIAGDTVMLDDTSFAQDGEYVQSPALEQESAYPSDAVRTAARFEPGQHGVIRHASHLEVGKDDRDFTVAYWLMNNRDHSGMWRETVKKHFDGRRRTFAMWLRPNDNRMHCRISTKHRWNEGTDTNSAFDVGVWRHVTYVKRGSELRMYVDGVFDRADALQGEVMSNNGDIYVGVRDARWRSDVTLDDLRIYSRALNDWEIAELHGLVGWYRMEDLAGATLADSSGVANHATISGPTPSWPLDAKEGTASVEFDGTNYAQTAELPLRGPGAAIAGWAKYDRVGDYGSELVSLGDHLVIRLDSDWAGGATAFGYSGTAWERARSNTYYAGSGWRHFAGSYRSDTRELSFFVDGSLAETITLSNALDLDSLGSRVVIGQHGNGQSIYNFIGMLDDVRVYNRPISRAEARALYYGGAVPGLRIVRWVEAPNP